MRHIALLAPLMLAAADLLPAQVKASERGGVWQSIDGTRVTMEYSRPRLRGRWPVYGTSLVQWGEVWTPGADGATTLEINRPVKLAGVAVPAGKYSIWTVVRQNGPWTFVLDPRADLFHTVHPDSTAQQIRFPITTRTLAERVEVLTWSIEAVTDKSMALRMAWGDRAFDVPLEITPAHARTFTAAEAAAWTGIYTFSRRSDAAVPFEVTHRNGALWAKWTPAGQDAATEVMLLGDGANEFVQAMTRNGELWATQTGNRFRFTVANGKATGFELLSDGGVVGRGVRR